ncbi:DUF2637 domain-containing protein [Streptomyces sp. NPDC085460]|uniref:DUF2637 domain-containing protein n=1 Tax=Streptomyces sp. NPDC085460 TaxID=3365723 RepID=UPI0037D5D4AC
MPDPAPLTAGAGAPTATHPGETASMQDVMTTAQPAAAHRPTAAVPSARAAAPPATGTAPPDGKTVPAAPAEPPWRMSQRAMRWVIRVSIVAAVVVAAIGFTGSYEALRTLAEGRGFGWFAKFFPIGVDAGIVGMYGLDLLLVWLRMPKALPRLIAHVLTAATILFNAAAPKGSIVDDPLAAGMHAILPLLFVAAVETARHLVIRLQQLTHRTETDQVPLHRWLLSPWSAWVTYRRMRLRGIPSYKRMVELDRELDVYRAWLRHTYGKSWKKEAGAAALLPFGMIEYGMSVEEALDQPRLQQEAADQRAAAEATRKAAAEAAKRDRELDAKEHDADAAIREQRIAAKVTQATFGIKAETVAAEAGAKTAEAVARVEAETAAQTAALAAEAARAQAEHDARQGERELKRREDEAAREEAAEKTARQAAAEAATARALAEKNAAEARAAEEEKKAAAAREEAAAADRRAQREAAEAQREADHWEGERLAREAERARLEKETAENLAEAARLREEAALREQAAVEAEDVARMGIGERADRKVARMILAAHYALPDEERPAQIDKLRVSLGQIEEVLGVSTSVAGRRRDAAMDLIAGGYTG